MIPMTWHYSELGPEVSSDTSSLVALSFVICGFVSCFVLSTTLCIYPTFPRTLGSNIQQLPFGRQAQPTGLYLVYINVNPQRTLPCWNGNKVLQIQAKGWEFRSCHGPLRWPVASFKRRIPPPWYMYNHAPFYSSFTTSFESVTPP